MGEGTQLISLCLFISYFFVCVCIYEILNVLYYLCVTMGSCMLWHVYGIQKTAFRSCFSP